MTFELLGRGEWAQWIDRAAANGWRARCADLLAALPPDRSDMAVWDAQRQWVLDAYAALVGLALSCDFPLTSFKPYASPMRERDTGIDLGSGTWRVDTNRVITGSDATHGVTREEYGYLDLYHRVFVTRDGAISDRTDADAPPDSLLSDVDAWGHNCHGDHVTGWGCMSWKIDELPARNDVAAIVPLRWHFEAVRAGLQMIAGYGSLGDLVEDSRSYVIACNLATLREVQAQDPAAQDESDIIAAQAAVQEAHWQGDPGLDLIAGLGSGAVAFGPVGAAIAGVAALPSILLRALGRAVQHPRDLWGRDLPLVETAALTGSFDPPRAPTHTAPTPPPSTSVHLTLYLPPIIPVMQLGDDETHVTLQGDTLDSATDGSDGAAKVVITLLALSLLLDR